MNKLMKKFTILYVEDDEITLSLVHEKLKDNFKEIFLAKNGEEGLKIYEEKKPDIVLTDIYMPKINGLEMAIKIKEKNYNQMIAILTSFDDATLLHKAINLGIDKYILKPVENKQFFSTLKSMVEILDYKHQKEKADRLQEIQSRTLAMGEMLQNVSHQWRQPLSLISTLASGLKIQKQLDLIEKDKELEMLEKIVLQTKYLSQTIEDFRCFFKNESIKKEEFDINNIIKKITSLSEDTLKEHNIKLISNSDSYILNNSETYFIQAILNIVNNSIDAFEQKEIDDPRYIFIDTRVQKSTLFINIKDNAKGIDKTIINKIFEPYFTTKHQFNGTGLGLYITLNIINKYFNGKIICENKEFYHDNILYKGASFDIEIPVDDS